MPAEGKIDFAVGTTTDGRVLLDFRTNMIDHMKLEPDIALDLAEALVEAALQAKKHGRLVVTPFGGS